MPDLTDLLPPELASTDDTLPDDVLAYVAGEDAALVEAAVPEVAERADRWEVADDGAAEWAMRHLAAAEDALAAVDQQRDEWVERIARWYDEATRPHLRTAEFMRGRLADYGDRARAEGRNTVALPSGKVATRKAPAAVEVVDEDAVLAWLDTVPEDADVAEARKVKVSVVVTPLRKATDLAEVPAGWEVELDDGSTDYVQTVGDAPPAVGDVVLLDGTERTIVAVHGNAGTELVALYVGERVPGVRVRPEGHTVNVKPGA